MTKQTQLLQLTAKLINDGISFTHDTERDKIILNPTDKPVKMSIPSWQFELKLVSYFNQNGLCICGNELRNVRQLHHALLSRNDVKGALPEIRNLIHHTYNTIEVCPKCIPHPAREKCAVYLAELYGKENIIQWYNEFPLKTKIYRIEAFLD